MRSPRGFAIVLTTALWMLVGVAQPLVASARAVVCVAPTHIRLEVGSSDCHEPAVDAATWLGSAGEADCVDWQITSDESWTIHPTGAGSPSTALPAALPASLASPHAFEGFDPRSSTPRSESSRLHLATQVLLI